MNKKQEKARLKNFAAYRKYLKKYRRFIRKIRIIELLFNKPLSVKSKLSDTICCDSCVFYYLTFKGKERCANSNEFYMFHMDQRACGFYVYKESRNSGAV